MNFCLLTDGSVSASFDCSRRFEGYAHVLHGGTIASILDGAMTNCLFSRGIVAMTAKLDIRFRRPLLAGTPAIVRGWHEQSLGRLHLMKAEILQYDRKAATASGKFMALPVDRAPHSLATA
jgi:acyl-coenzyme A thioesterase PaaI-like protein